MGKSLMLRIYNLIKFDYGLMAVEAEPLILIGTPAVRAGQNQGQREWGRSKP